jgi:hypothetical protein
MGACTKDFVDVAPNGVVTDEVFYKTLDGINQGVTGVYSSLNALPSGLTTLDMMYVGFGSIASDDAEAGGEQGGNDFLDLQNIDKGTTTPSEPKSLSDYFWAYNYKTILRANSVITKGLDVYVPKSETEKALIKTRKAEMLFIRAFVHFKMVQVYGGIPYVDHVLTSEEYGVKRDSISTCLHHIESDLIQANSLMTSYAITEPGRVSKGAIQSLLAKAYLYEASYNEYYPKDDRFAGCKNTYKQALIWADSVVNCGVYKLVGIDGETFDTYWNQNSSTIYPQKTPGYRYIFTTDGENSAESIFSVQSINDGLDYMLTRGTYLTVYTTVRNYNSTTLGWGFNCPTQSLVDEFESGDPRFKVAVGKTGDSMFVDGAWGKMNCKQSPTNMIGRKFECGDEYWVKKSTDGNGPTNYPYIRFGDVVLMAAEAAIKTNDNGKALTYVNMIRKRARNGATTGVPADLTTVSFEAVVHERRVELAMEGSRFFDLVRWGKQGILTGQKLQQYLGGKANDSGITCSFTEGKNDFFPIPEVEIINSAYNLKQYPGW